MYTRDSNIGTEDLILVHVEQIEPRPGALIDCSRGGVAQWVARLIRNVDVLGSSPIKGPRCFLEQETSPVLLSTGWFQEWIRP